MKNNVGINIPEILMPYDSVDYSKWAVVACDQYTSQPEYWESVEKIVGEDKSTLKLVFPEVYLEESEDEIVKRINTVNNTMKEYVNEGVLLPQKPGFIYAERTTEHSGTRKGLMIAVDLERYDFNKDSKSLIRATEGTIIERIPPRLRIREHASVELPHIMLLIDDPDNSVIGQIANMKKDLKKVYDFELMKDGGHIEGYKVDDEKLISNLIGALTNLADEDAFMKKYDLKTKEDVLLFAVGDGNHSLATAKTHWENIKKNKTEEELVNHPARFALVELVNLHDEGLLMAPIHRVLFNVDPEKTFEIVIDKLKDAGSEVSYREVAANSSEIISENLQPNEFYFISEKFTRIISVKDMKYTLVVSPVENFVGEYIKADTKAKVDYIHGDDVTYELASKANNIGILLPPIIKNDLFKTVILEGKLPRKTFSMGEANEKRYYLESRKIV
ncbi:DUF1015 domain-containing protein [Candidatus Clostridium stratigraminis]|uniref:DUF1015 domain-containing protein n=1 Tax=Candidatus Clostridium stratigraminis TaxID=3381661 RepID=A0ABW8TA53_9CLOT